MRRTPARMRAPGLALALLGMTGVLGMSVLVAGSAAGLTGAIPAEAAAATSASPSPSPVPDPGSTGTPGPSTSPAPAGPTPTASATPGPGTTPAPTAAPTGTPGPTTAADVLAQRAGADARQAVLVTGKATSAARIVAVSRWERLADGTWVQVGATARGRIGSRGWGKQWRGDRRTPVGTFTLTAAGGHLPAPPGTTMPYDWRPKRYFKTTRFADYVVRINYNVPESHWGDRPTTDATIDPRRGSGIWLHVDSTTGRPTAGCVSQPRQAMADTLAWLDPDLDPVIVLAPGPYFVALPPA